MRQRARQRRGFFTADFMIGLGLTMIVGTLLVVAVNRQSRGTDRLAQTRAAVSLADRTITALQTGDAVPQAGEGEKIEVQKLDTPSGVKGMAWAAVKTQVNGRSATLTGLVREAGVPK